MAGAGRDQNGVTGTDPLVYAVDLHVARALEQEIDLLCDRVVVPLCLCPCRQRSLRKALFRGVVKLADRQPSLAVNAFTPASELTSIVASLPLARPG